MHHREGETIVWAAVVLRMAAAMENTKARSNPRTPRWRHVHFVAWLCGALALQAPYQVQFKLGNGNHRKRAAGHP